MAGEGYEELLAAACKLAAEAGPIILDRWGRVPARRKADGSEVTDADLAAEDHIRQALERAYPDHSVLAEETGAGAGPLRQGRYCWAVDPLDGTQNYSRGFPCFATSIALLDDGVPVVGVVREQVTGRNYTAIASQGAAADGTPVRVAERPMDRDFFVGVASTKGQETPVAVQRLLERVNVRNTGSTALHLALVATGAIDAAFARRCYTWDIAAGYLLVHEAGGLCTDLAGDSVLRLPPESDPMSRTPFLAAGRHVHAELVRTVAHPRNH
ncbi:MAG: inositol monophosphatase family protein [Planctomycetota bacterium]|jgi:myo-inositol-1(or 4)-monophosphatase